jgi:HprK-related kinase A
LTVGGLDAQEVGRQLARGLNLRTGPFTFRITSGHEGVAHGLGVLYRDFPRIAEDAFCDFHIEVDRLAGPRRWIAAQANFWLDGFAPFKPLPSQHAPALLEWGMNWCLVSHAHHYLMLHAAALERGGVCIVLPGEPGAGKSTLAAALMLTGWRLLSDELTLVDRDDGRLAALARPVSLKNGSIDLIRRFDRRATFGPSARDTHKGTVAHLRPDTRSVAEVDQKCRPTHLVFPRWHADAATSMRRRARADAFESAAHHSFNYSLLGRTGFQLHAALIRSCDCWDFSYSNLDDALRTFETLCN